MTKINENFIIFLHIQKTGGITVQRIFRRKLGQPLAKRAIKLFSKESTPATIEESFKQKNFEDRYIIGHFCYGIHQALPSPFTYMTFLREPVSRIISLYQYSKTNPTAYYHKQAINKNLEEFAIETNLMELDNGQVRFLAGDPKDHFINRTPIGKCDIDLLEKAKRNIEVDFSFVGLTEYFDESILMLKEIMGWRSCLYLRRNTNKTSSKECLPDSIKEKIAERNWLDIQLYQFTQELLLRKMEDYQITPTKVKEFQRRNLVFNNYVGPAYTYYDSIKAKLRGQIGRPS